ncbi:arylacetamide deacetylase-like [Ptychodera flava]|uniref:arylacetamide deacetylase-like n=1 Tax=Ptychodera flava TaxID=63121 RepID=UPI003969EE8F
MGAKLPDVGRRTTTLLFIVGIVIAWYVYVPVPNDFEEPWKLRLVETTGRTIRHLAVLGEALGLGDSVKIARKLFDIVQQNFLPFGANITMNDTTIDGVTVRIYRPITMETDQLPAIVFLHGGGWTIGGVRMHHDITKTLSSRLGAVVISVDYRLAPENIFPAAVDDCLAVTKWVLRHGLQLKINTQRVAIMGDSAGGNMAAAISQILTEEKFSPPLKFQVLVYPSLQAIDLRLPSYQLDVAAMPAGRTVMALFTSFYIKGYMDENFMEEMENGSLVPHDDETAIYFSYVDPASLPQEFLPVDFKRHQPTDVNLTEWNSVKHILLNNKFSPLLKHDLRGLPPAYIVTVKFDVLTDEAILYSQRLHKADVPAILKYYRHGFHGCFNLHEIPGFRVSREIMEDFLLYAAEHL